MIPHRLQPVSGFAVLAVLLLLCFLACSGSQEPQESAAPPTPAAEGDGRATLERPGSSTAASTPSAP